MNFKQITILFLGKEPVIDLKVDGMDVCNKLQAVNAVTGKPLAQNIEINQQKTFN